ncbi:uncharacterized protein LOC109817934 [Cajanus cajan]|uniref:Ultraviolet-B-repressible protein n=1 Tax=Cajanus cajan TaxID=3821 RepID=A0A151RKL0_CAJCA|nr:uncharacterized protein LOC109817934 [Cajanus cajan]KYP43101.1 hypothetical protein KK1_035466 [Cajanus cajan]
MACVCVSMALPLRSTKTLPSSSEAFLKRSVVKSSSSEAKAPNSIEALSLKEKAVKGLTAAALTSYVVMPEVAHAAGNDFSPSLKNFLLSIAAGGVVLVAILGAVIGVSNFDPVKRT